MFDLKGVQTVLNTDRAKAFVGGVIKCLNGTFGIRQVSGSILHSQSLSPVERPHREYKTITKQFMIEFDRRWDVIAPLFQWTVRTSCKVLNGHYTPYEIVTGNHVYRWTVSWRHLQCSRSERPTSMLRTWSSTLSEYIVMCSLSTRRYVSRSRITSCGNWDRRPACRLVIMFSCEAIRFQKVERVLGLLIQPTKDCSKCTVQLVETRARHGVLL